MDIDLDPRQREQLTSRIADKLTKGKAFVACLADEVGEKLMGGVLRQRLSQALVSTIATRLHVQGKAGALLFDVLGELDQEWRILQGGQDGGPTPTADLVQLANALSKQLRDAEDLTLRTMKLALDEQRLNAEHASSLGPALFEGTGETIDVPVQVGPGEREAIRTLLGNLVKATKQVEAVTVGDADTPLTGDAHHASAHRRRRRRQPSDDLTAMPGSSTTPLIADENGAPACVGVNLPADS